MRKKKAFKIGEKEMIARELTVQQITQITDTFDDPTAEMEVVGDVDMLFPDRLPSGALLMSLEISAEDLAAFAPSEVEIMLDEVEAVNPTFAGLMQRLAKIGREALAARASVELPADSS